MEKVRLFIRWLVTFIGGGLLGTIAFGVVGEFFVELARERGLYEGPSRRLDAAMTAFSEFVTQTWMLVAAALLCGLAIGLWADTLMRRRITEPINSRSPGEVGINETGLIEIRKLASFSMKNAQMHLSTVVQDVLVDLSARENITLASRNIIFYLLGEKDASIMLWLNKLTEDKEYRPSLKEISKNLAAYIAHYEALQMHLAQILSSGGLAKKSKQSLEQWLPADREMIRLLHETLSEHLPDQRLKSKVWSLGIADSRFASFLRD